MTRHGVCMHCELPIHMAGRSPLHTDTEQYRCAAGGTDAEFLTADTSQEATRKAYEQGYEEAEAELEDKADDAYDEGCRDGRAQLKRELIHWVETHRKEAAVIDQLLDKLYE